MRYRVIITDPADENFRSHFRWITERSLQGAEAWRIRIIEAIRSLEIAPDCHALARESAAFPVEIRCLLCGKNRSAFRILYQIKDDEVRVLAIRRPSQDLMDPGKESGSAL
ncbi:MAG: type II toxin-antitoxin system RelE/ParE family toxin [Luteolibacter sp.]|uniref:type II toxin-antitoxin system RelE/ParE family toxin n=1 Tax=Luteolibacter sp. TaxID=1962973 RepID=UPI003267691B